MNVSRHTLQHFLAERASLCGPALVERRPSVDFHELAEESRRVAHGLARLGVGPGDRLALWLPKVPARLASFFACAQLGAIAVSVNTRCRSRKVADIVARSGARALVSWSSSVRPSRLTRYRCAPRRWRFPVTPGANATKIQ